MRIDPSVICQSAVQHIKKVNIWHYLMFGLILLLLGVIINEHNHLVGTFVSEIGIALIVSVIIGLSIEEKHKREFSNLANAQISNFKNSTFQAIFGWNVPKIYIELIQNQITTLNFYRKSLDIQYTILPIKDFPLVHELTSTQQEELFFLETHAQYIVENIRDKDSMYELAITYEKDIFPDLNYAFFVFIETDDFQKAFHTDELAKFKTDEGSKESAEHLYKLESVKVRPHSCLRAEIVLHCPRFKKFNKESFQTHYFSEHVTVKLLNKFGDLDATCMTSSEHDMAEYKNNDFFRWSNKIPLLPNQSITLWWRSFE